MGRRSAPANTPPVPDDLRCRRSNGKDWRCAEQALPELSYCAYHHHLNYHRPPSSERQSTADPTVSKRKGKREVKMKRDLANFVDLASGRRKNRRRGGEACDPETGFMDVSSRGLLPQLTGEDVGPSNPIFDALPVRFRPSNDSTSSLSNLLTNGEEELDIYNSMPLQIQIPVQIPVPEDLRCRRSNGKEWRCTEQALPGLSYCPYHHNLNYNRTGTKPQKPKSTSRTNRTSRGTGGIGGTEMNGVLCKRTNGKGWQCPNLAIEGLSYCSYHHQLNFRGSNNNGNNNNNVDDGISDGISDDDISGGTAGIIGLDGLLVKRPRKRKQDLFDGLHYAM